MDKLLKIKGVDLADLLDVTPSYITHIKKGRKKLSSEQCLAVHKAFGIPLTELRPDVYPKWIFNEKN